MITRVFVLGLRGLGGDQPRRDARVLWNERGQ